MEELKTTSDLVHWKAVGEVVKVSEFGMKKYNRSWRENVGRPECAERLSVQGLQESMGRHMLAWKQGEDFDSESGLSHLAHACWNLMMLLETIEWKQE